MYSLSSFSYDAVVEQLSSPNNSSSVCWLISLNPQIFVMQIQKRTESTGSHLKEDTATDQRAAARHLLKSEGGNFKRGRKKASKNGMFTPTAVQDKKPVQVRYFALELKITFKGKKANNEGAQTQLHHCAMPTLYQQSTASVHVRSPWIIMALDPFLQPSHFRKIIFLKKKASLKDHQLVTPNHCYFP